MKTDMTLLEKDGAPTIEELKTFSEITISACKDQNTIRGMLPTLRTAYTSRRKSIFFQLGTNK